MKVARLELSGEKGVRPVRQNDAVISPAFVSAGSSAAQPPAQDRLRLYIWIKIKRQRVIRLMFIIWHAAKARKIRAENRPWKKASGLTGTSRAKWLADLKNFRTGEKL